MCTALIAIALTALGFAGSASAKLVGEYTKFQECPWTTAGVNKCLYSITEGGEVVLGSKKVPIVNPTIIQGGVTSPSEELGGFSKLVAAKNGITLSKTPQPVPGGLAGIVPPESSPPLVKAAIAFFFENGLTGVNSTLEIAGSPSKVLLNENHLAEEEDVALILPLKIRLENPFLGGSCYVGSDSSPVIWNLTTGETTPPGPNKSITGSAGKLTLLEKGRVLRLDGAKLVDNAWSAPSASGCGGFLSFLVDPIINLASGLPAAAGKNTTILNNTIHVASSLAVKINDEEHP